MNLSRSFYVLIAKTMLDEADCFSGASIMLPFQHVTNRPSYTNRLRSIARRRIVFPTDGLELFESYMSTDDDCSSSRSTLSSRGGIPKSWLSKFTLLTPLWTTLVTLFALSNPLSSAKLFGSLLAMQNAIVVLMFSMGMAITPQDVSKALGNRSLLALNAFLCYAIVPSLALAMSTLFRYDTAQKAGILLLGSVSAGQASNLFALIAGGDVALSVICTLSTTLLGVIATPVLIQFLLGQSVIVDARGVLKSVASLVLFPLLSGIGMGRILPHQRDRLSPYLPMVGVLATLVLVAGGASNCTFCSSGGGAYSWITGMVLPSCFLSLVSGAVAFSILWMLRVDDVSKRTLVMETLSKSPTLAYVLANKHFGVLVGAIPAAAMVTLAVLGALVASIWSTIPLDVQGLAGENDSK